MKTLLLALLPALLLSGGATPGARAQGVPVPMVNDLVREGVALYDAGRYEPAAAKYRQALVALPGYAAAQAELALADAALGRHAEAIALCQQILAAHPESADALVYATYGNSLDARRQPAEALAVYRQGLRRYPGAYLLYFNQGVTLAGQEREAEAVASFQHAVALNPAHAGSHMGLGGVQLGAGARVPAILALARFLVLEPGSGRSAQRQALLDQALLPGPGPVDAPGTRAGLPAAGPKKSKGQHAAGPDDFGPEERLLASAGAPAPGAQSPAQTKTEQFIDQFGALCRALGARAPAAGGGFTRAYYVPYFVELEKRGYVPAFAYLAHSAQADAPAVQQWLAAHPAEVQVFREWSKNYEWPKVAF